MPCCKLGPVARPALCGYYSPHGRKLAPSVRDPPSGSDPNSGLLGASACHHPPCKPLIRPAVHPSCPLRRRPEARVEQRQSSKRFQSHQRTWPKSRGRKSQPKPGHRAAGTVSPQAAAERRHWKLRKGSGIQPCSSFKTSRDTWLYVVWSVAWK